MISYLGYHVLVQQLFYCSEYSQYYQLNDLSLFGTFIFAPLCLILNYIFRGQIVLFRDYYHLSLVCLLKRLKKICIVKKAQKVISFSLKKEKIDSLPRHTAKNTPPKQIIFFTEVLC